MIIHINIIRFPDIKFDFNDVGKLRGYIGNKFKGFSPLLHNHLENEKTAYRYPFIQYKIINKIPVIIGIKDGAGLLEELVDEIDEFKIGNKKFKVDKKEIENKFYKIGVTKDLYQYEFATQWLALNQDNFKKFITLEIKERFEMLDRILIGNMLSFFKSLNYFIKEKIKVSIRTDITTTMLKHQKMIAFIGKFNCNVLLPDYIGLGKSVSRGFGTIVKTRIL